MIRKTSTERGREYRQRQRQDRSRIDGYISASAARRLKDLATAWGISQSAVVERLLMEADDRYWFVFSSDTKK